MTRPDDHEATAGVADFTTIKHLLSDKPMRRSNRTQPYTESEFADLLAKEAKKEVRESL